MRAKFVLTTISLLTESGQISGNMRFLLLTFVPYM